MKKILASALLLSTITTTAFAAIKMQCPEAYQIQYLPAVQANHFYMATRYIRRWHETIVFRTESAQQYRPKGTGFFVGAIYIPTETENVPAEIACYYKGIPDPVWMYTNRSVARLRGYNWSKQQYGAFTCYSTAPADCPFMLE